MRERGERERDVVIQCKLNGNGTCKRLTIFFKFYSRRSVSTSHAVSSGHSKDHHNFFTNCLPARHAIITVWVCQCCLTHVTGRVDCGTV